MSLFGRRWSRRELEARSGRLEQLGGLRRYRLQGGPEDGVEQIEVRCGVLRYLVSPMRALDIGLAEVGGVPISWLSPTGESHPAYFDDAGAGWLRTAAGGLLMTCGLTQVGAPSTGGDEPLGLHGRAHHTPARDVVAEGRWVGDDYEMRVAGRIEEARLFAPTLRLTREIRSRLGEGWIEIEDEVENAGFAPSPHMILYHFNFGFPLLDERTEITFPYARVEPREPETPLEGHDRWQAPDAGYVERVYYHVLPEVELGSEDRATVVIRNPVFPLPGGPRPLVVRLGWSVATLPRLVQWKMAGAGMHVLGIEPANCHVGGRADERARGTLVTLEPGERRRYSLRLEIEVG